MVLNLLTTAIGPNSFGDAKLVIVSFTGLSRDALHIYVGMAIYLAALLMLRGPRRHLGALALVAIAALGGELLDHWYELTRPKNCSIADHGYDLWNTLFWPLMLTIIRPYLAPRRRRAR